MSSYLSEEELRLLGWLKLNPDARSRQGDQTLSSSALVRARRRPPKPAPQPRPGTIAAVICEVEHYGPEFSAQQAWRWAQHLFTPSDVRAWLTNGLRCDDLDLIVELRSLGIPPEAMNWAVRGETMLDRIRLRGYTAQHVGRTLRHAGLLLKRSS
jgi:hypothetical protein